ncbi:MAG TPA: hypothetical protein VGU61_17365 [Noviherbaspirillum sp.]|nr:hypothetical protein [Noviherbaspirillum sp.]
MINRLVLLQLPANRLFEADQYQLGTRLVIDKRYGCGNGDRRAMVATHAVNGYFDCHCFDSDPCSNHLAGQIRRDSK